MACLTETEGRRGGNKFSLDHGIQLQPLVPGVEPIDSRGAPAPALPLLLLPWGASALVPVHQFPPLLPVDRTENQGGTVCPPIPPSFGLAASCIVIEDTEGREDKAEEEEGPRKQKERGLVPDTWEKA